jgi:hypothetical protein
MKYQFQVDGRPVGPLRKKWEDAARDAVATEYACWIIPNEQVRLDSTHGAAITRIYDDA